MASGGGPGGGDIDMNCVEHKSLSMEKCREVTKTKNRHILQLGVGLCIGSCPVKRRDQTPSGSTALSNVESCALHAKRGTT